MLSNLFLIFLKKSEYKIVSEIITEPVLTGCSKIQIGRINQPTYSWAILDRTDSFHIWECVFTSYLEVTNIKLSHSKKSLLKFCPDYQFTFCNTYRGISSSQNQYKGRMQSRTFSIQANSPGRAVVKKQFDFIFDRAKWGLSFDTTILQIILSVFCLLLPPIPFFSMR